MLANLELTHRACHDQKHGIVHRAKTAQAQAQAQAKKRKQRVIRGPGVGRSCWVRQPLVRTLTTGQKVWVDDPHR